jgi:hypothetical protein
MNRYLLNSAVITAPGVYEYNLITVEEAKAWLMQDAFVSTIGYAETAQAASELFDMYIPCARMTVTMNHSDEALVFRLVLPPGAPRLDPAEKGRLSVEFIRSHCEIGLLKRVR